MATIVKLRDSHHHAILLGTGYGMYHSSRGSALFGDWAPSVKEGESHLACVAAADGTILWWPTQDFEVISIDEQTPAEILAPFLNKTPSNS
ncbi:MAG: hypothetical protein ACSHYB_06180 [Roseibacillus sp.]